MVYVCAAGLRLRSRIYALRVCVVGYQACAEQGQPGGSEKPRKRHSVKC
jgi:hypothetical protein